jgi:hypothetical protein
MSWQAKLQNPTVIAAVVAGITTLAVTIAGVISSSISAYYQGESEKTRAEMETRRDLIIEANKTNLNVEDRLRFFIASGLLNDDDCKLRKAILKMVDCVQSGSK